jgi:hypothetical protein
MFHRTHELIMWSSYKIEDEYYIIINTIKDE